MDNLISFYRQRLNLQNAIFSSIEHEDAMIAIVYKISQENGADRILKICTRPSDYACEVYFLKHFEDILPVPRIIDLVKPEIGIDGAILMECVPGELLKITELTYTLAYGMGSLLAKIHSNKVPGYGDLTQPQQLSSGSSHYFTLKFDEGVSECSTQLPKELLDQCHSFYNTHIHLLDSVDGPCITHRDFRPGNLIINNGKIQGIIDWSSARASFAEEDFCDLELSCWPTNSTYKKSFLDGYASIRPVPDYEKVISLLRLSRAIAIIGFTIKSGTWENKNSALHQRNRKFLEEFFNTSGVSF